MNKIKQVLSGDSSSSVDRHNSTSSDPRISSDRHSTSAHSSSGPVSGGAPGQLPVQSGVTGRAEESGPGRKVTGSTPGFTDPHKIGHSNAADSNNFALSDAEHTHHHLGHKTHDAHYNHQVEEVTRQKEHERHIHHVQHHTQDVHDTVQHGEKVTQRNVPTTRIEEKHGSTAEDIAAFKGLAKHRDETIDHGTERKVVDLGETVNEHVHHHVHNVVQPILKTDHHHHETIKTVIPSHHITHEAPVVHESLAHKAVSKADFLKSGGVLGSNTTHDTAGILTEGGCDRSVDGVGETLARELNLKSGTVAHQHKADTRI